MTCGGCSGAVTRALQKAQANGPGRSSRHGTIPYDDVLAVIKKTGKEVSIIGHPWKVLLIS
ncbi:hypothetical protein BJV77DRAFT_979392 [Russula vinacea]|nr:hypothetical protein BJV77DRAFT_979392 [Russula vinacea]